MRFKNWWYAIAEDLLNLLKLSCGNYQVETINLRYYSMLTAEEFIIEITADTS